MNLVDEMNKRVNELGCEHSHFVNATGMHSDNHYTSLNDLLAVTIYCMKYQSGREILETLNYINSDGNVYSSTVNYLAKHNVEILGGKTGFTTQAGQLIMVLYRKDNRSYLLMLSNSDGDNYTDTYYHYEDCINIFERLYN